MGRMRKTYASLICDYNSYIKIVRKLVNELDYGKSNLSKLSIITKLIHNGVFSFENTFGIKNDILDILDCKDGLNVLWGSACCRHVSGFVSDVVPDSRVLTCVTEVKNPFKKEANHVVNLTQYNDIFYAFDATRGGVVFKFDDNFRMIPVDDRIKTFYNYKPYAEIVLYKRTLEEIRNFLQQCKENKGILLSKEEEKSIELFTIDCLDAKASKDMINDFRSDTALQMEGIKEQIKEIRIKQKSV